MQDMAPLVQLAVLQPAGLDLFHTLLLKWSYVLNVRGTPVLAQEPEDGQSGDAAAAAADDDDDDDDDDGN
jgi:hypothetical protein